MPIFELIFTLLCSFQRNLTQFCIFDVWIYCWLSLLTILLIFVAISFRIKCILHIWIRIRFAETEKYLGGAICSYYSSNEDRLDFLHFGDIFLCADGVCLLSVDKRLNLRYFIFLFSKKSVSIKLCDKKLDLYALGYISNDYSVNNSALLTIFIKDCHYMFWLFASSVNYIVYFEKILY